MRFRTLAALVAASLVALACGIKVPPALQDCRLFGCPRGEVCTAGATLADPYVCKAAPDPCAGKTPICERNDDTECWAMTADGKCTWFPKPDPTCPAPPAEAPACPAGQVPADPSWVCGADTGWQWQARCKPAPAEEPAINPAFLPPLDDEVHWKLAANQAPDAATRGAVQAAVARYKARRAVDLNAEGTCLALGPAGIDRAFEWITAELHAAQVHAGQPRNAEGGRVDALSVNRPGTNLWEEWHLFEYGHGCFTGNPFKGVWQYVPEGGVGDACPAEPCPPRTFEDGKPHWQYNAKLHTMGNADSTPVVVKAWDYCKAVGLGWQDEAHTVPRGTCPVRPDGHPERVAVEAWLLEGGPVRDSRNGQDCTPNHTDNPAAFLAGTGNCRNCNTPRTVCTAWF